jgi:hypothetical protein
VFLPDNLLPFLGAPFSIEGLCHMRPVILNRSNPCCALNCTSLASLLFGSTGIAWVE